MLAVASAFFVFITRCKNKIKGRMRTQMGGAVFYTLFLSWFPYGVCPTPCCINRLYYLLEWYGMLAYWISFNTFCYIFNHLYQLALIVCVFILLACYDACWVASHYVSCIILLLDFLISLWCCWLLLLSLYQSVYLLIDNYSI